MPSPPPSFPSPSFNTRTGEGDIRVQVNQVLPSRPWISSVLIVILQKCKHGDVSADWGSARWLSAVEDSEGALRPSDGGAGKSADRRIRRYQPTHPLKKKINVVTNYQSLTSLETKTVALNIKIKVINKSGTDQTTIKYLRAGMFLIGGHQSQVPSMINPTDQSVSF